MTSPGGDAGGNPPGRADRGPDEPVAQGYPPPGPSAYDPGYGQPNTYGPAQPRGTNTMAVASLVTSVAGFAPYFGGVLSIVGIVLGTVALNQIKETPQSGYGLAVAGIVVGVATLIIGLIWTIFAMR